MRYEMYTWSCRPTGLEQMTATICTIAPSDTILTGRVIFTSVLVLRNFRMSLPNFIQHELVIIGCEQLGTRFADTVGVALVLKGFFLPQGLVAPSTDYEHDYALGLRTASCAFLRRVMERTCFLGMRRTSFASPLTMWGITMRVSGLKSIQANDVTFRESLVTHSTIAGEHWLRIASVACANTILTTRMSIATMATSPSAFFIAPPVI